jgi:hypothetical protein
MFGLFAKKATKERLQGRKTVTVNGSKFVIRKINPLIDFEPDRMPSIFTSFQTLRKTDPSQKYTEIDFRKMQKSLKEIVAVGVVEPVFAKTDAEGITVDDLFRDPDMGYKLFLEIMAHSMNMFSGMKELFFYLKTKLWCFIHWRNNMDAVRRTWLLKEAGLA